jgi:flagellar hook protein FlgE
MPFRTALSGLNAASTDLRVIGNNVANAGTTGFKQSRTEFADVYPASGLGAAANAPGAGVRVSSITQQFSQGNIGFTDNVLDLAVSGQGFFLLDDGGAQVFSRAGAFQVDAAGFVVNSANQQLTVFQPDAFGNITGALGPLFIDRSDIAPSPTGFLSTDGGISASLNLDATTTPAFPDAGVGNVSAGPPFDRTNPTTYHNSTSMTIYDSLGNPVVATMYYRKTATNLNWDVHMWITNAAGVSTEVLPQGFAANTPARLVFNSNGTLASVTPTVGPGTTVNYQTVDPATGSAVLDFEVAYAGTTQYGSAFSVNALTQDGFTSGRLTGIDIASSGIVQARFTNGQSRTLGQVALGTFSNPQGLQQLGDTAWAETADSGAALIGQPNTASLGSIQSGALEGANVDLTEQLVAMITAQRNFQSNAQVISTADTVTQTIINIR